MGVELSGDTVRTDFYFTGLKLYMDAAWKLRQNRATATAGLVARAPSKNKTPTLMFHCGIRKRNWLPFTG
jgi:hypothetical protein